MKQNSQHAATASSPRKLALDLLLRCERDSVYSNLALDTVLRRHSLSDADRGLFTALTYGVLETRLTLDYLIESLSARPLRDLEDRVLVLLRMGIYQLRYMDRIPPHAALNETVSLAEGTSRKFVNAVLREYTRREKGIAFPDPAKEPVRALSVAVSVPEPLCRRFIGIFGYERAEAILSRRETGMTLRVNTKKTTVAALTEKLRAAGFAPTPARHVATAIRLEGGNPALLPGFDEGLFFVQDEASVLCTAALDAKPGMTVLDVCACPGSKSFGIALDMNDEGSLLAFDLHENKLPLITNGAARLGLHCITARARDGRDFDPTLEKTADRVLCDVPCSGFGVLAKKPEIRYKDLTETAPLPAVQYAILDNASRYVAPGGILVYSTCTLLPEENEDNVARFLAAHPAFSPLDFALGEIASAGGTVTLTPDRDGTDGFFIAKLQRRED